MRPVHSVVVALGCLAVAGCSNGGGPAPGCRAEPLPAAGPGDATALFPLLPGNVWRYEVDGGPVGLPRRLRQWVAGTRQVDGHLAAVVLERDLDDPGAAAEESLTAVEPGGVLSLGAVADAPGLDAIQVVRFPVEPGPSRVVASCTSLDLGEDVDGDGRAERFDLRVWVGVEGSEEVAVPAGRFPGASRVVTRFDSTVHFSAGGDFPLDLLRETDWYAPGVGLVRAALDDGTGPPAVVALSGYDVGGLSSGVSDEQTLFARSDVTATSGCPSLATGGGRVFAALFAGGFGPADAIQALTLSPDAGLVASAPALEGSPGVPAAAFDGTRFLVAAVDLASGNTVLRAQRFGVDGLPVDPPAGFPVVTAAALGGGTLGNVAAAGADGAFLVVFTRSTHSAYQALWAVRVSGDGAVSEPLLLHEGEFLLLPAVAAGPGGWLVAWSESSFAWTSLLGSNLAVRALRLAPDGAPRDAAPIEVSAPADRGAQVGVGVATDGTGWLLAWTAHRGHADPFFGTLLTDLAGARLTADGALLDGPSSARGFSIAGGDDGDRSGGTVAMVRGAWIAAFALTHPTLEPIGGVYALPLDAAGRAALPGGGRGLDVSGAPGADLFDCPALLAPDAGRPLLVWRRVPAGSPGTPPGLALDAVRIGW